jgi:TPR repeat protein
MSFTLNNNGCIIEYYRREHGTLPPLSNDEALILNHMYQIWLNQSPEEKEGFLRQSRSESEREEDGGAEEGYSRHFRDTLQQASAPPTPPLLPRSSSLHRSPPHVHPRGGQQGDASHTVSVSLCITTIKNSLAQHEQHSDSLLNLVDQLDVLIKAPEPTRTHANDLLVMLLSPDFIHRDLAALEHRIDLVSTLQQEGLGQEEGLGGSGSGSRSAPPPALSAEQRRDREVHLAVASACCILLALLAEAEHLISARYRASLPLPFQHMLAQHQHQHPQQQHEQQQQRSSAVSSETGAGAGDVKRLYDDIATSYYLRSLTIAFSPPPPEHGGGSSSSEGGSEGGAASQGCGGRNSIAAMQLGSKYLRGGVERGALLSTAAGGGAGGAEASSSHEQAVRTCEQEYRQAFQWFLQAALLENPIAQHKVGYFYDEGLPHGGCQVHLMEAVKWYSRAAELMPDSMHNLAKIYEDGRGGFEADLKQAVTLYSVAAARGFPLSQVNLGRLFLLGEDGVQRDREAGKRLLTLAAESGDADAQMVVGMIHATPAFECYDLALSEHWLRCSLAGGKQDAERLLGRVRQQQQQQQQQLDDVGSACKSSSGGGQQQQAQAAPAAVTSVPALSQAQLAAAAKQRGEDFLAHSLLHAAVLEFSRAFELDRSCLHYFVDRLETLYLLGHFEECLSDSSLLLDCVDVAGEKLGGPQPGAGGGRRRKDGEGGSDNATAMKRWAAAVHAVVSTFCHCTFLIVCCACLLEL